MSRYRKQAKADQYDTGFPIAVIGIAMLSLLLFLVVGHVREENRPQQSRVFVPVAIEGATAG